MNRKKESIVVFEISICGAKYASYHAKNVRYMILFYFLFIQLLHKIALTFVLWNILYNYTLAHVIFLIYKACIVLLIQKC